MTFCIYDSTECLEKDCYCNVGCHNVTLTIKAIEDFCWFLTVFPSPISVGLETVESMKKFRQESSLVAAYTQIQDLSLKGFCCSNRKLFRHLIRLANSANRIFPILLHLAYRNYCKTKFGTCLSSGVDTGADPSPDVCVHFDSIFSICIYIRCHRHHSLCSRPTTGCFSLHFRVGLHLRLRQQAQTDRLVSTFLQKGKIGTLRSPDNDSGGTQYFCLLSQTFKFKCMTVSMWKIC